MAADLSWTMDLSCQWQTSSFLKASFLEEHILFEWYFSLFLKGAWLWPCSQTYSKKYFLPKIFEFDFETSELDFEVSKSESTQLVQQGCFFFRYSHATHSHVRRLVFDNYQRCPVSLSTRADLQMYTHGIDIRILFRLFYHNLPYFSHRGNQ